VSTKTPVNSKGEGRAEKLKFGNQKAEIRVRTADTRRRPRERARGWRSGARGQGRRISRIYYAEASDVVGQLKKAAASVLAGIDALEACFDTGEELRAQGVDGSGGQREG
jgi:hypothetical protein